MPLPQNRTPIIKDGKIVGYAVQVASNPKLPSSVLVSMGGGNAFQSSSPGLGGVAQAGSVQVECPQADLDFPELEDYSILEPIVVLSVSDTPIRLKPDLPTSPISRANLSPMSKSNLISSSQQQIGVRRAIINNKIVTLVPISQSQQNSMPHRSNIQTIRAMPPSATAGLPNGIKVTPISPSKG
jgi:hypothetical protein